MASNGVETADGGLVDRERLAIEMARRYYIDDVSTPDLAAEVGVSRSTISRLITMARERGWVRIDVTEPEDLVAPQSRWLTEHFGLETIVEVTPRGEGSALRAVARRAAATIGQLLNDEMTIGVAWGNTITVMASELTPLPLQSCRVVQLNGAGGLKDLELDYAFDILGPFSTAWNAAAIVFPVPAFFDFESTREALWRERTISRVREVQQTCDVAVFSVGSTTADAHSRVHSGGYLNDADRAQLDADQAIGDIATYFFREDGTTEGIELNSRASGLPLDVLTRTPTKVCIAQGRGKAKAALGALRGGYVTHLIADKSLLDYVYELATSDAGTQQALS